MSFGTCVDLTVALLRCKRALDGPAHPHHVQSLLDALSAAPEAPSRSKTVRQVLQLLAQHTTAGGILHWEQLLSMSHVIFVTELLALEAAATGADLDGTFADSLFLSGLEVAPCRDLRFQEALTALRKHILGMCVDGSLKLLWQLRPEWKRLAVATACQCYIIGFILPVDAQEQCWLDQMASPDLNEANPPPGYSALTVLGCYQPLLRTKCDTSQLVAHTPSDIAMIPLWRVHVVQPTATAAFQAQIEARESSESHSAVQQAFTAWPYPTWGSLPSNSAVSLCEYAQMLGAADASIPPGPVSALVAGAGTCKEAVDLALRIQDSIVTAVDLSSLSLAIGAQKAATLGLQHRVLFEQNDINQYCPRAEAAGRRYWLICSGGVLHHNDLYPGAIAQLASLLHPGGLMRIGVYSRLARRDVEMARSYMSQNYCVDEPQTTQQLQTARQDCLRLAAGDCPMAKCFRRIMRRTSIYTAAELHDLLFTPEDTVRDLPDVAQHIEDANLSILDVELCDPWLQRYREFVGMRDGSNTCCNRIEQLWQFEQKHPNVMGSMYVITTQRRFDE